MAGKGDKTGKVDELVESAVKEGVQAQAQRQKFFSMQRALQLAETTKRKAVAAYNKALETPNHGQIFVALGAAAVSSMGGFKFNEILESKTKEWVDEEGASTIWRKMVVHGTLPFLGAVGMVGGAFIGNGLIASGVIGLSAGLLLGSLLRSVLVDEEVEV